MLVKYSIFALLSGLIAGLASYIYGSVFQEALLVDYSEVINPLAIFLSCIVGTVLATLGYALLKRIFPKAGESIFGILFALISFMSIIGVFAAKLPDSDDESFYYLIYGFAIPMHFFPFMIWFSLKPIFLAKR